MGSAAQALIGVNVNIAVIFQFFILTLFIHVLFVHFFMKLSAKVRVSIILPSKNGLDKMTVKIALNVAATWPGADLFVRMTTLCDGSYGREIVWDKVGPAIHLHLPDAENCPTKKNICSHCKRASLDFYQRS